MTRSLVTLPRPARFPYVLIIQALGEPVRVAAGRRVLCELEPHERAHFEIKRGFLFGSRWVLSHHHIHEGHDSHEH